MSPPIEALGTIGFLDDTAAGRDDRQSAFVLDLLACFFAVVGLIGRDRQWRSRCIQYLFDGLAIMDLSASYREGSAADLWCRRWRGFSWFDRLG